MYDTKYRKSSNKKSINKTVSQTNLIKPKPQKKIKKQNKNKQQIDHSKLKKRIQLMETPDILFKINYKGKKLSVPISKVESKSLKQIIEPYILRFERQILKNTNFDLKEILTWKCSGNNISTTFLKDYYLQLDKPIYIFKNQIIEIEPVWKNQQTIDVTLKDFEIIKCIGTGGFSKVFLVRKLTDAKFFALKLMQKQGLVDGKQCVVTNQLQIMKDLDNPYILKLYYAFQTKNFVAFALQYCPGGELFHYLRKVKKFTEDQARFCFIQILTGFRYLHDKGIIYRDIKPQNIIIDAEGHLKIADYGLSKLCQNRRQKTYTYCGSPQYMAPQMLAKTGHTFAVDYYCLGALLYQLVTGNPPFYSRDVQKIFYAIQNEDIYIPQFLSPQIGDLLEGLLVKDPNKRLGSLGGIRQILGHPWVRKTKVSDVIQGVIQTPIKVDLMTFNVNTQQIGDSQQQFFEKLKHQLYYYESNFEKIFQSFSFNRNFKNSNCNFQKILSMPMDTSKQNLDKLFKNKSKEKRRDTRQNNTKQKDRSKQSHDNKKIKINNDKKLKQTKSKKKLNQTLVQRAKIRQQKSIKKNGKRQNRGMHQKIDNTLNIGPNKSLKRIKSYQALRYNYFK